MTKMITEEVSALHNAGSDKSKNQELLRKGVNFFTNFRSFTEECIESSDYHNFLSSNAARLNELLLELDQTRGLIGGLPKQVNGKDLHHISFSIKNSMNSTLGLTESTGSTVEGVPMVFRRFLQTCLRDNELTQSVSSGELIAMNTLAGVMVNLGLPVVAREWTVNSMI